MTDETPHIRETLAQYLTENQDPQQVARIYEKVSQLLTRGEQVIYITDTPTAEPAMYTRDSLLSSWVQTPIAYVEHEDRKVIKELDATAKVWLGTDGLPFAAESSVRLKGRALVVIGFEHPYASFSSCPGLVESSPLLSNYETPVSGIGEKVLPIAAGLSTLKKARRSRKTSPRERRRARAAHTEE